MPLTPEKSKAQNIKLTIIGAGLVGLACLVDLLNRARSNPSVFFDITVIEKRDLNFIRGQKIIMIDDESANKGVSWIDFCKRSFFAGKKVVLTSQGELLIDGVIPQNQTSRYTLLRKILRQKETSDHPVNVSIKQLQTSLLEQIKDDVPNNVTISWYVKSSVTRIHAATSMLTVESEMGSRDIVFHALLNCEGEKRQTVNIINRDIQETTNEIPLFQYQALESTETYHMAVKIKIKEPISGTYHALIRKEQEKYMKNEEKQREVNHFVKSKLSINGHELTIADLPFLFDPNIYKQKFYIEHWVPKYFVAGLIPQEIHHIEDPAKKRDTLLKWASYLLAYNYHLDPENFMIDTKDDSETALQQRANTFVSNIKAVNDPVMVLPNNSVIVLLGDACMSPYYWEGISSTIGLNEALSFLDCIFVTEKSKDDPYQPLRTTYAIYKAFILECLANNSLEERYRKGVPDEYFVFRQ